MELEKLTTRLEEAELPTRFLREKKHEIYLVGGCIRDTLLGRETIDFDFAVEGSGLEYAKLFAESLNATFVPLKLDEGRVVYRRRLVFDFSGLGTNKIEEDLRKRDFTINAIAARLEDILQRKWRLIDPTSGVKDLQSKKIRMVSQNSLPDDPLRILRAFRFASQLDFEIDGKTLKAAKANSHLLTRVAGERISCEIFLILQTESSWSYVKKMSDSNILLVLFPELRQMDKLLPRIELLEHSIFCLKELEGILAGERKVGFDKMELQVRSYFEWKRKKPLLKLATLFHDIGKPDTFSADKEGKIHFYGHDLLGEKLLVPILKERLRMSKRETTTITHLVRYHMRPHLLGREKELTQRAMRRFFADLQEEWVGVLLLAVADALATENGDVSKLKRLILQLVRFREEQEEKGKIQRLISGDDLIRELHLEPGPEFREILERVEEEQLEGRISTREEALELLRKMLGESN